MWRKKITRGLNSKGGLKKLKNVRNKGDLNSNEMCSIWQKFLKKKKKKKKQTNS